VWKEKRELPGGERKREAKQPGAFKEESREKRKQLNHRLLRKGKKKKKRGSGERIPAQKQKKNRRLGEGAARNIVFLDAEGGTGQEGGEKGRAARRRGKKVS